MVDDDTHKTVGYYWDLGTNHPPETKMAEHITLGPNGVIVINSAVSLTSCQRARLLEEWSEIFPYNEILILQDCKLVIVEKEK